MMPKFKIGDRAIANKDCSPFYRKGDRGRIVSVGTNDYVVQFDKPYAYGNGEWFASELIKEEIMFKVGDKVRCIEGPQTHDGKDKRGSGWKLGHEFVIKSVSGDICWPGRGDGVWQDNLELVKKDKEKFKVGDSAEVLKSSLCNCNLKVGKIYEIKGKMIYMETNTGYKHDKCPHLESELKLVKENTSEKIDFYTACGRGK